MARKRLLSSDRRALILIAATKVFAEYGLSGAKTQQIAAEADVSEALIFRHFPSKNVLYCAVLRKLIKDQDEGFRAVGAITPDTAGLVGMLYSFFKNCASGDSRPNPSGIRVLYASLAGDGNYAKLTYRRAIRLSLTPLQQALDGARAVGDLPGEPVDATNIVAFLEHLGSNVCVARIRETPLIAYTGEPEQFIRQLVLFAGRGIGLTEEAITTHLAALTVHPSSPPPQDAEPKKRSRTRRPVEAAD